MPVLQEFASVWLLDPPTPLMKVLGLLEVPDGTIAKIDELVGVEENTSREPFLQHGKGLQSVLLEASRDTTVVYVEVSRPRGVAALAAVAYGRGRIIVQSETREEMTWAAGRVTLQPTEPGALAQVDEALATLDVHVPSGSTPFEAIGLPGYIQTGSWRSPRSR